MIDRRIDEYRVQRDERNARKRNQAMHETYDRLREMLGREGLEDLHPEPCPGGVWVTIPRRFWFPLRVFVTPAPGFALELSKGPFTDATVETAEDFWLTLGDWK